MTNEETLTTHSLSVHTKHNTRWLTICGLLMAINVGLSSFGLPVPGGHLYLNDIVIVAAALMLDPLGAFLVGGVGAFWETSSSTRSRCSSHSSLTVCRPWRSPTSRTTLSRKSRSSLR